FQNDPGVLVEYAQKAVPGDFATFAPMLFEYAGRGDSVASAIVMEAVEDLEETIRVLIDPGKLSFCLLGGLAASYSKRLSAALQKRERLPEGNALSGALSMAVSMFGHAQKGMKAHG